MANKILPWVELPSGHCIVAMKVIPEKTGFRIYVVWDWEVSVKAGIFSAYKSDDTYKIVTDKAILEACNVGWEMSADDAYKMFPELKK